MFALPFPGTSGRWLATVCVAASVVGTSCGSDVSDPCSVQLEEAPGYLTRELFVASGPGVLPLENEDGSPVERVITTEAEYEAFRSELGRRLSSVDFESHDVLAVVYSSSNCTAISDWKLLAHPADGSAVLSVAIFKSGCASFEALAVVVEVSKSARPHTCVRYSGT